MGLIWMPRVYGYVFYYQPHLWINTSKTTMNTGIDTRSTKALNRFIYDKMSLKDFFHTNIGAMALMNKLVSFNLKSIQLFNQVFVATKA